MQDKSSIHQHSCPGGLLSCWAAVTFKFSPVKCIHTLCRTRWWCIIFEAHSYWAAAADKIIGFYELSMISMLNKQEKKNCQCVFSSNSWVGFCLLCCIFWSSSTVGFQTKHSGTKPASLSVRQKHCLYRKKVSCEFSKHALTFRRACGDRNVRFPVEVIKI